MDEKVSIGLRGWRFDPDAVFDEDGDLKPVEEIPEDDRLRVVRLTEIVGNACHVCMLRNPEEGWSAWRKAEAVYGEPTHEVLVCDEHEPVFLYWFWEMGGESYRGMDELQTRFHGWVEDGGEAPEDYAPDV